MRGAVAKRLRRQARRDQPGSWRRRYRQLKAEYKKAL